MQCLEITKFPHTHSHTTSPLSNQIPRIPADQLSYDDFFREYMFPNRPVILTGLANEWKCFKHWTTPGQSNVDFEYLRQRFQSFNDSVPVADCGRSEYNAHVKLDMSFDEFIRYWQHQTSDPGYQSDRLLYLKDWHLRKEMPDYRFYETPYFFGSDWLNEHLVDTTADDYMFVYMGPKGTWTPFHSDVFGSYSWSTNITGTKRWIFLAPGEEEKLVDGLGNLPFTVDVAALETHGVRHWVLNQEAGETVFVPSGWYHQVTNEADTISVNHNWFNACNVDVIWRLLKDMLRQVRREIDDCREMDDFDGQCQVMLRAGHGMNYEGFLALLENVARRRMKADDSDAVVVNGFRLGREHTRFDMKAIRKVLLELLDGEDWKWIRTDLLKKCKDLLNDLNEALVK